MLKQHLKSNPPKIRVTARTFVVLATKMIDYERLCKNHKNILNCLSFVQASAWRFVGRKLLVVFKAFLMISTFYSAQLLMLGTLRTRIGK